MENSQPIKEIFPGDEDPVKIDGNTPITTRFAVVIAAAVMLFSAGMGWMAYQNENDLRKTEIRDVSSRVLALEIQGAKIANDLGRISKDIEYMTKMMEADQRRRDGGTR